MSDRDIEPAAAFYFVRHGQTVDNERGVRCGGDREADLTERGLAQARAVAARFAAAGRPCGPILASPLRRTVVTARLFADALGSPVIYQDWLRERALGGWNGVSIAETQPLIEAGEPPPGGETEDVFTRRVREGLAGIAEFLPRRPLLVGSKGIGRILFKILAGQRRMDVENCEIIEFSLYQRRDEVGSGSVGDRLGAEGWHVQCECPDRPWV